MHFSTWHPDYGGDRDKPEVKPQWVFCLPCQEYAQLEEQGSPMGKTEGGGAPAGWHIEMRTVDYSTPDDDEEVA